ncbi:MAG: hypothetical protein R3284_11885, partial [Rubricoccaceae bacterium]|nr:hypothetical protein [Rubricoccaceae bacterium]
GVGASFLRFMGYPVNENGEHITENGSFIIDVRGPDLIVVTGTSTEFDNGVEMTIIGPREVDRRVRRIR